jgi:hypothetical protein
MARRSTSAGDKAVPPGTSAGIVGMLMPDFDS